MSPQDDRIKKHQDPRRDNRSSDDTRTPVESALANPAEPRKRSFRDEFMFQALPNPPAVEGWHFCWLTTTNVADPIHRRIQMGYVPVRADEVPGFEHLKMKSGEWEGFVSVNEMLLFKIPMDLYKEIITEFHHHAPNEEEERLRANLQNPADGVRTDSSGRPLSVEVKEDEGFRELMQQKTRKPIFTE